MINKEAEKRREARGERRGKWCSAVQCNEWLHASLSKIRERNRNRVDCTKSDLNLLEGRAGRKG